MSEQLTVAVISGSVAVVVALIGIAGAIVAQLVTSRKAHRNALALFEKQANEQARVRLEDANRQDRHRFAADRRTTYSTLMRTAADLVIARKDHRYAKATEGTWTSGSVPKAAQARELTAELEQVLGDRTTRQRTCPHSRDQPR